MSQVIAAPGLMQAAATELAAVGANLNAAHLTASGSTVALLPAAADEVSTGIAHLFSREAEDYQKLAGRAAAYHEEFVQRLSASAGAYASAEAANVSLLDNPLTAGIGTALGALGETVLTQSWILMYKSIDWLFVNNPTLYFAVTGIFSMLFLVGFFTFIIAMAILYPGSPLLKGVAALMNGRG